MPSIAEMSELQRYCLVKYYFACDEEEHEDRIEETISQFKAKHPNLPWYPSVTQVTAFIDAVDEENDPKTVVNMGSKKKVDTEENWEKIKAILIENPKTTLNYIVEKTGLKKGAGRLRNISFGRWFWTVLFSDQNDEISWLQDRRTAEEACSQTKA